MNIRAPFKKVFVFIGCLLFILQQGHAQKIYLSLRKVRLVDTVSMEFDVMIRSDVGFAPIPLKFFQSGYSFARSFVNGGVLSAQYVPGSSDLESAFGKTWGFSFNQNLCVLNQSANVGSVCPGAFIGSAERRIGRFRVTNTVKWGCADDSLRIMTTGSGHLNLALAKYKSADCSDPGSVLCTADAILETSPSFTLLHPLLTVIDDGNSCDSFVTIEVGAAGGLPPYQGAGQYACTNGYFQFTLQDSRGCSVQADTVIAIKALVSYFMDSACEKYLLPWGDTALTSGIYSHRFFALGGCDSMVYADIQIRLQHVTQEYLTICKQQLPWSWKDKLLPASGDYETIVSGNTFCDSIFRIRLIVDSLPVIKDSITGLLGGLCQQRQVTYGIAQASHIDRYLWQVPSGAVITTGQGSNNIMVDFSGARSDGEICVTAINGCGYGQSQCLPMTLKPFMISGISGLNQVKKGQRLYYGASAYGATSYNWTVPAGWQIISGQGSEKIYVRTGPQAGQISVTARNSCGAGETISRQIGMTMARSSERGSPQPELSIWAGNQLLSFPIEHDDVVKEIRLLDISGRTKQVFKPTAKIEMNGFPPGSYILQVITGRAYFSKAILIR